MINKPQGAEPCEGEEGSPRQAWGRHGTGEDPAPSIDQVSNSTATETRISWVRVCVVGGGQAGKGKIRVTAGLWICSRSALRVMSVALADCFQQPYFRNNGGPEPKEHDNISSPGFSSSVAVVTTANIVGLLRAMCYVETWHTLLSP